jgi:hypothetical protein
MAMTTLRSFFSISALTFTVPVRIAQAEVAANSAGCGSDARIGVTKEPL